MEYVKGECWVGILIGTTYFLNMHRSGAKGSAKAKQCVKCEGKGWTFVHNQVLSLCLRWIFVPCILSCIVLLLR